MLATVPLAGTFSLRVATSNENSGLLGRALTREPSNRVDRREEVRNCIVKDFAGLYE